MNDGRREECIMTLPEIHVALVPRRPAH